MLEIVDVSADIHVYLVFTQYRLHFALQIFTFAALLGCLGINGMVTGHDGPVGIVIAAEFIVEPL